MSDNPSDLRGWQVFLTGILSGVLNKTVFFGDVTDEIRYGPEFSFVTATMPNGKKVKFVLSVEYADDQESV